MKQSVVMDPSQRARSARWSRLAALVVGVLLVAIAACGEQEDRSLCESVREVGRGDDLARRRWVLAGSTLLYLATVADGPNFNAAAVVAVCVAAFGLVAGGLRDVYGVRRCFLIGGAGLIVSLSTRAAGVGESELDQLIAAARDALATGLARTMWVLLGVMVVTAAVVLWGLRGAATPPAEPRRKEVRSTP